MNKSFQYGFGGRGNQTLLLEANQIQHSLLPWHPFEGAKGEDEMLNISGLCLSAATDRVTSSYYTFVYRNTVVRVDLQCFCCLYALLDQYSFGFRQTRKHKFWHKHLGQIASRSMSVQVAKSEVAGVVQKPL